MSRKPILSFLLIIALFFSTGCWDAKELEKMIFLNAIGIDYQNGSYIAYAQVINFSNLAKKQPGATTRPDEIWVAIGKGRTMDIATDNIYPSSHSTISWAHIKAVIFSKEALKHGSFQEMLDAFDRYPEIRTELFVYASKEPIDKVLTTRPILNVSATYTQMVRPENNFKQYSIVSPITLRELSTYLNESSRTMIIPYLSMSTKKWLVHDENTRVMMTDGSAIVQGGHYKGDLNMDEQKGIRWVNNRSKRVKLYLFEQGKPIADLSINKPKAKIKMQVDKGTPHFSIEIKAGGGISEMLEYKTTEELQKMAAKDIENQVRTSFKAGLKRGTDVLQLEKTLYQSDPQLWHRLVHHGEFPLREQMLADVQVKVLIQSSGRLFILNQK